MERLHPILSHFPIALILTSVFFDALAYALKRPSLHVVGFWNLAGGVIGAAAAAYSGLAAERGLAGTSIPDALLASHRQMGLWTLWIFGGLLLARLAFMMRPGRRVDRSGAEGAGRPEPSPGARDESGGRLQSSMLVPVYLVLALIGGSVLARTGHSGNRLVFEAAAGVMSPEYPAVAMLPEGGASRQPVWGLGAVEAPAYTRAQLSPAAARLRARIYLRRLVPGKPLFRDYNGCKVLHLPLLHQERTVAGVMVDPDTGTLVPRGYVRCSRNMHLDAQETSARAATAIRQLQVGRAAWQGGHGAYWNVPLLVNGRMVDILRIDMNDGKLVPLSVQQARR
jgi:uncharacterized membrane protein